MAALPKGRSVLPLVSVFAVYLPCATVLVQVLALLARGKPEVLGRPGGFGDSEELEVS